MLKVFKQETFQGNLSKMQYFEGWYFKHVSSDLEHVYSFIPGISLSDENPHAFIQIINGVSGESRYIQYSLNDFSWNNKGLYIKLGNSLFTDGHIYLDIKDGSTDISGKISYKDVVKFPKSILSPGIMGWYSYVPYMECKHCIVSITHGLCGKMAIDGEEIDFMDGKGYIEKDWGTSFPKEWLWLHSNTFIKSNASLTISIANIPWLRRYFIGFIAFLYIDEKIYKFASYNKSRITKLLRDDDVIYISIENHSYKIDIRVVTRKSGQLIAPAKGNMVRKIKESIDSELTVRLSDKQGSIIYEDAGRRAGLEVIETIFEYFK